MNYFLMNVYPDPMVLKVKKRTVVEHFKMTFFSSKIRIRILQLNEYGSGSATSLHNPNYELYVSVADPDWIRIQSGPWIRIQGQESEEEKNFNI